MTGGVRVGSGRPADPNALRRYSKSDTIQWRLLPAAGRTESAPPWPLTHPTRRELALWEQEWARPQAIMWESNKLELEVALYVRALRMAESSLATTNLRVLVAQYMNDLGISLRGMQSLRWIIDQPIIERPPAQDPTDEAQVSDKDRFLRLMSEVT